MPRPIPCLVKTRLRRSQRCTSLASLPRFKLFLKNGAGGVHDQLWQKCPVETNERITRLESRPYLDSTVFSASVLPAPTQSPHVPGLFSAHSVTFSLRTQRLKAFDSEREQIHPLKKTAHRSDP